MTLPPWLTERANSSKANHEWFRIVNAAADDEGPAEVFIYDTIGDSWFGGVSAQRFAEQLREIDDAKAIDFHINSPGGDVYDGIAIMNAIRQHPGKTTAIVDGLAASAASFIAMGADEVVMADNSELMIHDASGLAWGDAAEMRRMADDLDRVSNNIASVYAKKAGGDVSEWRDAMLAESWYSAQEAVDAKLADRVLDADPDEVAKNKQAHLTRPIFAHAGRANAPAPKTPAASGGPRPTTTTQEGSHRPVFTDEQLTTMRQELGLPEDADSATILAAFHEALDERAEPHNATQPAGLPEGVVAIDKATLDALRADASAGREALTRSENERRGRLVDAAVNDGRIRPADRERWLNNLSLDPEGYEDTLSKLEPGLVPVNEIGHAKSDAAATGDDALYDSVFGKGA